MSIYHKDFSQPRISSLGQVATMIEGRCVFKNVEIFCVKYTAKQQYI